MKNQIITLLYFLAAIYLIAGGSARVGIMITSGQHIDALPIIAFILGWFMIVAHIILPNEKR